MAATSRESYTHTIRSFFCTTFFLRFVSSGHISNANKRTLCALSLALFQHMYRIFAEFSQFLFELQMNRWLRANCSTRRINWASIIIKNTHERASNAGNFANNYRFIEFNGIYICFTGQKHTHKSTTANDCFHALSKKFVSLPMNVNYLATVVLCSSYMWMQTAVFTQRQFYENGNNWPLSMCLHSTEIFFYYYC